MKRPPPLVCQVEQSLRRLGVSGGLVVAVSGGPDSVALLRAAREVRGAGLLIAAHLNHQLRGPESDADEAFVRDLCAGLSLDCRYERLDVRGVAGAEGANLEGTARRLRYDWLARVAGEAGAGWVATGHTANDQAETVLHRLLRGAGLKGLRGIAARRGLAAGVAVVRPLLKATRAEVMAYLNEVGQPYRQDRTNLDPRFTRNRIRHQLLPRLAAEYNPKIVAALTHLAEQAEEGYAAEEEQARALLAAAELPPAGTLLVFDRARLAAAPRTRVRELFRLAWEREGWPMGQMGFDAWERVAAVAQGEAAAADLPGGIRIRYRGAVIQVGAAP
ncbi:MAG TPA: tRNA lysidine(34) synthetase TilS [Gemmataceae bacterium]|nr:tRNA lysidine(34) synthetase TilS [Gemmataceae bacterium]